MADILENFGKGKGKEDPVVHFYETFLAAYIRSCASCAACSSRRVPVVSYIVRSIDHLLKTRFDRPPGWLTRTRSSSTPPPDGDLPLRSHPLHLRATVPRTSPAPGTATCQETSAAHLRFRVVDGAVCHRSHETGHAPGRYRLTSSRPTSASAFISPTRWKRPSTGAIN